MHDDNCEFAVQTDLNIAASFDRRGRYIYTGNARGKVCLICIADCKSLLSLLLIRKEYYMCVDLRPNSVALSWSQTGPKLVADLQRAGIWPITHYLAH